MLRDKALKSLEAGDLLLARGFTDDAATRYYYAMYRAAVHVLTERGKRPEQFRSGAIEWDHSMVENNAGFLRGRQEDRWLYERMRKTRTRADYKPEPVERGRFAPDVPAIREFVLALAT